MMKRQCTKAMNMKTDKCSKHFKLKRETLSGLDGCFKAPPSVKNPLHTRVSSKWQIGLSV